MAEERCLDCGGCGQWHGERCSLCKGTGRFDFDELPKKGALEKGMIQLKIKKMHPDAVIPSYATSGSACFDLCAVDINGYTMAEHAILQKAGHHYDSVLLEPGSSATFRTGLAFEVPPGWSMLIFSRSGHGFKQGIRLANSVGVIDADYRGEVLVRLTCDVGNMFGSFRVRPGDRIAQAMLVPASHVEMIEVDDLSQTDRGELGFGSTGA